MRTSTPGRRQLGQLLLALAVALLITLTTVIVALLLRSDADQQERRLLDERAIELSSVLSGRITATDQSLQMMGAAEAIDGPHSVLFASTAASVVTAGGAVAVVQPEAAGFRTIATAGAAPAIDAARAAVLRRTEAAGDLVSAVTPGPGGSHMILSLKVNGSVPSATPTIVYIDRPLHTLRISGSAPDSPYRDLNVALYASSSPDPANLLLVYGTMPSSSQQRASHLFAAGSDHWLTVVSARSLLISPMARSLPWVVLAGGLLLAALIGVFVHVLLRRREYALNLVEQRTKALREAQASAERANLAKSEFLSRMSHELRTPMNAVLGFAQLLELYHDLNAEQRQAVGQISRAGKHLLDLINEILDITRIESGQLSVSLEPVRVGALVNDALDIVGSLAADRGITLHADPNLRASDVLILADQQRAKQILLNLLTNAIKYNRVSGSVTLDCVRTEPGRLRLRVADTGPGIRADQLELAFAPFERLGADQTAVEGTGIGLTLSRHLAEAMDATLDVQSVLGEGSTFWVDFPTAPLPMDPPAPAEPEAMIAPVNGRLGCVLLVEDNLSNVVLLEKVLEQRPGVTLVPCLQGRQAVELARLHRPVLVLLDLNLADIPGEEVLRRLRTDPETAHVPVIVVTADATARQRDRLLAQGAEGYLTKPVDVPQLLRIVDERLEAGPPQGSPPLVGAQSGSSPAG